MNLVLNEPLGVVVHILPFNYPIVLLAWQVAAALAAAPRIKKLLLELGGSGAVTGVVVPVRAARDRRAQGPSR